MDALLAVVGGQRLIGSCRSITAVNRNLISISASNRYSISPGHISFSSFLLSQLCNTLINFIILTVQQGFIDWTDYQTSTFSDFI